MSEPQPSPRGLTWRRLLAGVTMLVLTPTAIATVLGYCGVLFWVFDLAAHFRFQYAIICAMCVPLLLLSKAWRCAAVGIVMLGLNVWPLVPLYRPVEQVQAGREDNGTSLRVMQFNMRILDDDFSRLQSFIDTQQPDLIVGQEVNTTRRAFMDQQEAYELAVINQGTPYMRTAVWLRRDAGLDVVSMQDGIGPGQPRGVMCALMLEGRTINVLGLHPFPPMNAELFADRQNLLAAAGKVTQDFGFPTLVVGDLNMTRFSQGAKPLEDAGLRDSMLGMGWQGSWPSVWPLSGMIGIDHVWVTEHWRVEDRFVGPDLGSDHRPVICDVTLVGSGD